MLVGERMTKAGDYGFPGDAHPGSAGQDEQGARQSFPGGG